MTEAEQLADFVHRAAWEDLSPAAREALKVRVLDSLACALGALDGPPIVMIREHTADFGGREVCTMIGGGRTAPDRAALYNGALVRYLDFNDIYLAKGETCHPSDNLGAVLAAAEYANESGRTLLTSFSVAYQVQCRLSDVAPVRARGFDHVSQGTFAATAGAAKALSLEPSRIANALGIAGTAYNPLRVTRTGSLSHWKGLAYPDLDRNAVHAAFMALRGITGPLEVFEGNKGWRDTIVGGWAIDWTKEDLERVTRTDLKRFNAEAHSQSAIEGLLELMAEKGFSAGQIEHIRIDIFDVAFNIIGGGEEGDKKAVFTKEQADHSLPYMVAVAALDGQVLPAQYAPERIARADVQSLLRRVDVVPDEEYTRRFPAEHACKLTVRTTGGAVYVKEKTDYEGFHTRPMTWPTVEEKFHYLAEPFADDGLRHEIIDVVKRLEDVQVNDLTGLLAKVSTERRRGRSR